MTQRSIGVAIVGCGNIADRHASAIADVTETNLVTVHDLDPARAAAFAAKHGVEPQDRYVDLLRRHDVDVVVVTAPATVHAELALPAVESGKHVLIEKPLDVDLGAAETLVRAADHHGVRLSVVSQNRFHDDVLWLHDLVRAGRLGRPISFTGFSLWSRGQAYYDEAPGRGRHDAREGGVLLNQGVHLTDLMLWLFGRARSVSAHAARLTHEMAAEDTISLSVEFESGALGSLQASTSIHPQEPERIELRCENGTAVISGGKIARFAVRDGIEVEPPPSQRGAATDDRLEPFRRQHRDFATAVLRDESPLVTPSQARDVVALIGAAYRSASRGERVALG